MARSLTTMTGSSRGILALAMTASMLAVIPGSTAAQEAGTTDFELGELELLWEAGGPTPETPGTMAMDIDPLTGDIWVAVAHDDQFWVLSPDGEYKETWGESGSGPGQFRFDDPSQADPWASGAIAFAPDGSFYVGDLGNYRIQQFDPDRSFMREWGSFGHGDGQFSQIVSIDTDGETVFVGDCDRWDTQAFDHEGTFLRSFGGDMGYCMPHLDGHGVLRTSNSEYDGGAPIVVAATDQAGTELHRADLSIAGRDAEPWTVAAAADGTSYVSMIRLLPGRDEHVGIFEVDPSGTVVRGWAGGGDELLVSPDGDALYVARGMTLPHSERWSFIRKYALPAD
jgi:DNA-binding beta-propeller fold protein YncE